MANNEESFRIILIIILIPRYLLRIRIILRPQAVEYVPNYVGREKNSILKANNGTNNYPQSQCYFRVLWSGIGSKKIVYTTLSIIIFPSSIT